MRVLSLALASVLFACSPKQPSPTASTPRQPEAPASSSPLTLVRTIGLPGVAGRIDHLAYDPGTRRIFIAALGNGSLEAVDLATGAVTGRVGGLKEPQGVVFDPAGGEGKGWVVVACGGDGTLRAFDPSTLEARRTIEVGEDADNVRLAEGGKLLLVGVGSGDEGGLAVLDAAMLTPRGTVGMRAFGGHPEAFEAEPGTDRVFANVPGGFVGGGGAVKVVDRVSGAMLGPGKGSWELGDAGRNFPMALDAANHRLYVGCRRPARLVVLDTEDSSVIATLDCVGDADEVFVVGPSRVYVVGGDGGGGIDVFETADHRAYARLATIPTRAGARTGLWAEGRLFVAVPEHAGEGAELREYRP